jgi:hypothetical protein
VTRPPFQLLADLDPEARAALRSDIERHGVQVPIVRTTKGAIVDGHHRAAIAEELGIDCPEVTIDLDDRAAIETALRLNLLRRHLGPVAWAAAFRRLAEVRGVRLGQGGDRKSAHALRAEPRRTKSGPNAPVDCSSARIVPASSVWRRSRAVQVSTTGVHGCDPSQ